MILGLSEPFSSSRHGVHFPAGFTPFDPFGELDAMNILKVKFYLQNGWESLDTFRSRMWAFGGFAAVQLLDVVVNITSSSFSVEEFRAVAGSAGSPKQNGQYPGQARVPPSSQRSFHSSLPRSHSLSRSTARQSRRWSGVSFVAATDVPPSLPVCYRGNRSAVYFVREKCKRQGYDEPIELQLMICHLAHAFLGLQARAEGDFGVLLTERD